MEGCGTGRPGLPGRPAAAVVPEEQQQGRCKDPAKHKGPPPAEGPDHYSDPQHLSCKLVIAETRLQARTRRGQRRHASSYRTCHASPSPPTPKSAATPTCRALASVTGTVGEGALSNTTSSRCSAEARVAAGMVAVATSPLSTSTKAHVICAPRTRVGPEAPTCKGAGERGERGGGGWVWWCVRPWAGPHPPASSPPRSPPAAGSSGRAKGALVEVVEVVVAHIIHSLL